MRTLREDEHRGSTNEDAKIGHFEAHKEHAKRRQTLRKHKDDAKRGCIYRGRTKLVYIYTLESSMI